MKKYDKINPETPNLGKQKRCPNCDNLVGKYRMKCPFCSYDL
jgi:hypothetical protein